MTWEQIRAARGLQSPQPTPTPTPTVTTTETPTEVIKPKRYGLFGENSLFNDLKTGIKKLQAKGDERNKTLGKNTFEERQATAQPGKKGIDAMMNQSKTNAAKQRTPEGILQTAQSNERRAETVAKVVTAPVRFTAGSLATVATSYALEKANSNKKYTPKTDAEKLIIGETDIQRLTKQEDLYGIVARSTSIPVALTLAAIVENPFIKGTGIGTTIKASLESAIEKKVIKSIGTKELIRLADEAIQAEVKIGKIKPGEALKVSSDINNFRVKAVSPKLKKAEDPLIQEAKKYKSADEFVKAQGETVYRGGTEYQPSRVLSNRKFLLEFL